MASSSGGSGLAAALVVLALIGYGYGTAAERGLVTPVNRSQHQGTCPSTGSAEERGLSPAARHVLRCVDAKFGHHAYSGRHGRPDNPSSDHPHGRAVDVMTGSHTGEGWRIARWARRNADDLDVSYVIFDARIWSQARGGWRNYTHPSGSRTETALHRDHVHISTER